MATSLECRVPFLDHQLVELASRMPEHVKIRGRELKHILKVALAGVLPRQILYRSKRGFGAPMGAWFKGELATVLKSFLSREVIEGRGLFEWEAVSETMRLHESNRADHTDHLMALLNFEIWARIFLDGESPSDLSDQIRAEAGR
jgi:asparagine synthase (glutamine-hydrolysing)